MKFLIMLTSVFAFPCDMLTCNWEGHCLDQPCAFYDENGNGCANDYMCMLSSMTCVEKDFTVEGCSWLNHCYDDPCAVDNDCDSDLVCISEEEPIVILQEQTTEPSEPTEEPIVILQEQTTEPCEPTEEPIVILQEQTTEPTEEPIVILQEQTTEPCEPTEEPIVILQEQTTEPCEPTEEPVVPSPEPSVAL